MFIIEIILLCDNIYHFCTITRPYIEQVFYKNKSDFAITLVSQEERIPSIFSKIYNEKWHCKHFFKNQINKTNQMYYSAEKHIL